MLFGEGFENEYFASWEERGVDFKRGVLGRRPDERYGAVLNAVEEGVLLSLVETMNLVYKKYGAFAEL